MTEEPEPAVEPAVKPEAADIAAAVEPAVKPEAADIAAAVELEADMYT